MCAAADARDGAAHCAQACSSTTSPSLAFCDHTNPTVVQPSDPFRASVDHRLSGRVLSPQCAQPPVPLRLPGPALPRRCPCLYCFTRCPQVPICRNGSGFSSDADDQASRSTLGNMPALAPDHLASLPGIGPVMVAAAADSFGSHSLTCQEHINF